MNQNKALEHLSKQLERHANTDPLTELANRRAGSKHLKSSFQRCKMGDGSFSVAILDLDKFKLINDNYGHDRGDEVLVAVAHCLSDNIRPTDRIYRWGGEEFLLVMHDTDTQAALDSCERLRSKIAQLQLALNMPHTITASFGVTSYQVDKQVGDILKRADNALYSAKRLGRNRVEVSIAPS